MAEKATAAYHKVEDAVDSEKKSNAKQRTAGTAQMYLPFSFIFKIIETQRQ